MYCDFIEALNKKYNCTGREDLSGMDLQHYIFASTSNKRGKTALEEFENCGFSLKGLKILDVGCAYGGFSIEAARMGAVCYGIEISEPLYDFAMLNNKNEEYETGSCEFILTDVTSADFLNRVPKHFFDLIIVNDVFEHIYDTVQLLSNLSMVSGEKCAIYFKIPNGNELRFVAKEGHSGYCGISIVNPLSWFTLDGEKQWNIYYRQFEYYKALFEYYGYTTINFTNYPSHVSENKLEKLEAQFHETKHIIVEQSDLLPEKYAEVLSKAFAKFEKQYTADKAILSSQEFFWKYGIRFWTGFAQKEK